MAVREYVVDYSEGARLRVRFRTDRGSPKDFTVQFEVFLVEKGWTPAIRYDCAHGTPHRHEYRKDGERRREVLEGDYASVLNQAILTVQSSWEIWYKNFMRGMWP